MRLVEGVSSNEDGCQLAGMTDPNTRTIYVDCTMPKEEISKTFLHEVTHAIMHEAHLHNDGWVEPLIEEVICDAVAEGVLELLGT